MKKSIIKKFREILHMSIFRHSSTYFVGSLINAVLPFLLLPVLTRYLTPADYGIVATSMVLIQLSVFFIGFNTSGLIASSYFDNDPQKFKLLVSTNIVSASVMTGLLTMALIITRDFAGNLSKFPAAWIPVVSIIAFFGVIQSIYLTLLQVREEPRKFISINILLTTLNLVISIVLVVGMGLDWRGRILAAIISGLIVTIVCIASLIKQLKLLPMVVSKESFKAILSFGFPLIPHFIGGWVMTMAPRLFLNHMANLSDTGLFSVGYNIASPIALIIGAGNQAYLPELFKKLSSESTNRFKLSRILLMLTVALPVFAVLYGLLSYIALPLIVGPKFYGASEYIIWLGLGFAMQGVYFIYGNFVVYSKKTYLLSWRADFLGGISVLIFCPLFIYLNGPIGAAQATFLAFTISMIGCTIASNKAVKMPWKKALLSFLVIPEK